MLNFLAIAVLIWMALSNPLGFMRGAALVVVLTLVIWGVLVWAGLLHV